MKSELFKRPRRLKLKSVNVAMFVYFCALSILLILLVDLVFYLVVPTALERQASERIVAEGDKLAEGAAHAGDEQYLEALLSRFDNDVISACIFTVDGEPVAPERFPVSQSSMREAIEHAASSTGNTAVYTASGSINYVAKLTFAGNSCVLLVTYPLGIVRETVGSLQIYLLVISAVVLVLAFLISFNMSRKLTGGLKSMSDAAVRLARGDYSVQFNNVDYKEMAMLSDTFNYVRDEVKKSQEFQREILANVTHDLKTPLTMIKAYASMVQEISGDNPEKRNKHLQVIIDEADRLTGLVNDVLSVSKVNSNIGEINLKVFNFTDFLYGIIGKFGYLQESGYSLMVDVDSGLYTRADEEKIGQVIYNLLGNAVSYTGDDKTVYISLKKNIDGKRIRFSVRDTGKGIPQSEIPNIWERYYRSEENHVRPVKGTGIGLNIVKLILESHKFDFGVESEVGHGSTFWVDFPCISSDPSAPA